MKPFVAAPVAAAPGPGASLYIEGTLYPSVAARMKRSFPLWAID